MHIYMHNTKGYDLYKHKIYHVGQSQMLIQTHEPELL